MRGGDGGVVGIEGRMVTGRAREKRDKFGCNGGKKIEFEDVNKNDNNG